MKTYQEVAKFMGNKTRKKVEYETYIHKNDNRYVMSLFGNDIITYHPDGTITIHNRGWQTVTTKKRFNTYTPIWVFQNDWKWFVMQENKNVEFYNGMTFDSEGRLIQ